MATEQPNEASIFNTARKIESSEERIAYLTEACQGDAALQERVEKLLVAYAEESQFLEQAAIEQATIIGQAEGDLAASMEAGLAPAFGDEAAVVIGDANHSVLRSLSNSLSEVPRVSLRESSAEGDDPVSRPSSPEMPTGDSDSRYRLDGEIARGGMGAIIKGRDTDLGRDLAIKVLLDSHKDKPEVIQRFVEEAQIGGQLQHPGIAPVYELGQFADKRPFFAMKLVKGETLAKLMDDREDAADERGKFIGIFEQICQTMAYAHSRGVIHRDLKPANIMVGAFGEVQVMDWGLAKVLPKGGVADEKKSQQTQQGQSIIQTMRSAGSDVPGSFGSTGSDTQMGSVMGTPAYMPPEQALGEIDQMNERADVFGLGAILAEILTGKPPYVGDDGTQVYRLASRGKLEDCFERLAACEADAELITLTRHCLELEPADRPGNAGVLAESVSGYLESVETKLRKTEIERAAQAARVIEERKRRRVTLALAASVLLMVCLGGGSWFWLEQQQAKRFAAATAQVNEAIGEAELHQGLANKANLDTQLQELEIAVGDAEQAVKLTEQTQVDAETRNDANALLDKLQKDIVTVRRRVKQAAADRTFQERLDDIRLSQADGEEEEPQKVANVSALGGPIPDDGFFDIVSAADQYEAAFQEAGLNLETLDVSAAAAQIKRSAISESIIAALDNWARSLPKNNPARTMLLDVADAADASKWRQKLRAALHAADTATLKELAASEEVQSQSPVLIAWLGAALREAKQFEASIAVLRQTQQESPGDFWINYELGKSLLRTSDKLEGIGFIRAAIAIRPDSTGALWSLSLAFRQAGRRTDANSVLQRVAERRPKDLEVHNRLANSLWKNKQFKAAVAASRQAIKIDPENSGAYTNLAIALQKQDKHEESLPEFHKAIELDPQNFWAHYQLGWGLARLDKLTEALAAYDKALEIVPKGWMASWARTNYGLILSRQGKLNEAVASYRKAIELDKSNATAYLNLASVSVAQGKLDDAAAELLRAIEVDPKSSKAHTNYGAVLSRQGKLNEAVASYRKAIELDQSDYIAHSNLGEALTKQGKLEEAITEHRKAIQLNPVNAVSHIELADTLVLAQMLNEAVAEYRAAIRLDPNLIRAHINLGNTLKKQGKLEEAIAEYRKATELDPTDVAARVNLGTVLFEVGQMDQAIVQFRKAVELDPAHVRARLNLGVVLIGVGQMAKAIVQLRKAIELDPTHVLARVNLGVALRDVGRVDQAVVQFRKAVELDPKDVRWYCSLGGGLSRLGQRAEAIATYQKAMEIDPESGDAHNELAWFYVRDPKATKEDVAEGVKLAQRACELALRESSNWNTFSLALYRSGEWKRALEALKTATELDHDSRHNWLFLAMTHWQLDDKDEAHKWYDKALAWQQANKVAAKADAELQGFYAEAAKLMAPVDIKPAADQKTPSEAEPDKKPPQKK